MKHECSAQVERTGCCDDVAGQQVDGVVPAGLQLRGGRLNAGDAPLNDGLGVSLLRLGARFQLLHYASLVACMQGTKHVARFVAARGQQCMVLYSLDLLKPRGDKGCWHDGFTGTVADLIKGSRARLHVVQTSAPALTSLRIASCKPRSGQPTCRHFPTPETVILKSSTSCAICASSSASTCSI